MLRGIRIGANKCEGKRTSWNSRTSIAALSFSRTAGTTALVSSTTFFLGGEGKEKVSEVILVVEKAGVGVPAG